MSSNFKHKLSSLLILIGIVLSKESFAKALVDVNNPGTIRDHITQLEYISDAHSQLLTEFQQQILDNQADIHFLRGQIQENQHQLNQIIESQKQITLQINSLDNISAQPKVTVEAQNKAIVNSTTVVSEPSEQNDINSDNMDYNAAIRLAFAHDKSYQDEAIIAFQNFIKKYPDSIYQPNANYWLGQLNYNKNKKDDAAFHFALVVKKYPKSSKAPDAMYKIGIIMQEKGVTTKARTIYQQIISKYPNTNSAKQAQKRLLLMK